ncbi:MAG: hypothetical protein AAF226_06130, partial [Verrucomicrobiota bacterium]
MSSILKSYFIGLFFLAFFSFVGAQQIKQITILNETSQPLAVSWVGQDGVVQPYGVPAIQPGSSGQIQSYVGTEWQVSSNQSVVDTLTVSDVTKEWRISVKVPKIAIQNNSTLEYGVTLTFPGKSEAWHTEKVAPGASINIEGAVGTAGRVWDPSQNQVGTFSISQDGEVFAFPEKSTMAPPPVPSGDGTPTNPTQPTAAAEQKNEPLGEPVVKYGFQTDASPIAEQVDLRGIWYRSAPPNLARYMGEGYIFSNDVIYKSNRELSIQQISGYADQMIMLRHEMDNVYFL